MGYGSISPLAGYQSYWSAQRSGNAGRPERKVRDKAEPGVAILGAFSGAKAGKPSPHEKIVFKSMQLTNPDIKKDVEFHDLYGVDSSIRKRKTKSVELKDYVDTLLSKKPGPEHLAVMQKLERQIATFDQTYANYVDAVNQKIMDIQETSPNTRVVNLSSSVSRAKCYLLVQEELRQYTRLSLKLQNPDYTKENIDHIMQIEEEKNTFNQTVVNYVDGRLDNPCNPLNMAVKRFNEVTRQAAQSGVTVVVAAGNEEEAAHMFERPGSSLSLLANESVISVAASDDQKTPDDYSDDKMASFSSRGDDNRHPTIAANGTDVLGKRSSGDSGTSFSAPQVTGVIHRMLKVNPTLTFEEIRMILQTTAVDTEASPEAEGGGILNPNEAVSRARR